MAGAENDYLQGSKLVVTTHAANRWASRVRGNDHLPRHEAEADLMRCAQVAEVRATAPDWLLVIDEEFHDSRYLMLGDDVAIVIVPLGRSSTKWAATTVVTRTDAGSVASARRRSERHLRMLQERERTPRRIRHGRRDGASMAPELDD
ncbi:MAG: hypothetical protein ITG02_00835 [Patulibacter sp.]|nr:hypothetical protein [Patulibacter sp.]